jgi:hypothetical protein
MLPACWRRVQHCHGQVQTSIDSVVSIAICQRRRRQRFRSARASLVRKTISSSGWIAITKSSPSHLIATCRRYSMRHPLLGNYSTPLPQAKSSSDPHHTQSHFPRVPRMQIGKDVSEAIIKRYESDNLFFRGSPGSLSRPRDLTRYVRSTAFLGDAIRRLRGISPLFLS